MGSQTGYDPSGELHSPTYMRRREAPFRSPGGWAGYAMDLMVPLSTPHAPPLSSWQWTGVSCRTPPLSPYSIVLSICIFFVPFAFSLLCQPLDGNQTQRGIPLVTSIPKENYSLCFWPALLSTAGRKGTDSPGRLQGLLDHPT